MNLTQLLKNEQLDDTILFGWYGGGNFGDELLLAGLATLLSDKFNGLRYIYLDKKTQTTLRQTFDCAQPLYTPWSLLRSLFTCKNIIVGGGGHWGLDMNKNVFIMSLLLFMAHILLRKKVYLVGIGYYSSTNTWGHWSARIIARAATYILARDKESYDNFQRYSRQTYLDKDIAFYLMEYQADKNHDGQPVLDMLGIKTIHAPTTLIGIRRMKQGRAKQYDSLLQQLIETHPNHQFIAMMFEPHEKEEGNYRFLMDIKKLSTNVTVTDFRCNPLDFIAFMRRYRRQLRVIAPQYHVQLIAAELSIPILPIAYDNKVAQLHQQIGSNTSIAVEAVTFDQLQEFVR